MTLQKLTQYGKPFQIKVIGALLTDKGYLLTVRDVLREDYFDSDTHKWIIGQILKYFDKYHTTVTMDVLKVELQKIENEVLYVFPLKSAAAKPVSFAPLDEWVCYVVSPLTRSCLKSIGPIRFAG
jgi:replicative DNA helicase